MAELVLKEFINYPNILNIELGAGCGNFGQKYHSECFLTEKRTVSELKDSCKNPYVTIFSCDAYNIPCSDNRFEKIIMCNPYGYGFKDKEDGLALLTELSRVLNNNGTVIVLSTNSNGFAMPDRILRRINEFNSFVDSAIFSSDIKKIDCKVVYPNHKFFNSNGLVETYPTNQICLTCIK